MKNEPTVFYHVAREDISHYESLYLYSWENMVIPDNHHLNHNISELTKRYPNGLSSHGQKILSQNKNTQSTREKKNMIQSERRFEEYRLANFPDKPSRFTSIFACKTLEDARRLIKRKEFETYEGIYEVSCKKYFIANMNLVHINADNKKFNNFANEYWSGIISKNTFSEVLMQFPVTIIQQLK